MPHRSAFTDYDPQSSAFYGQAGAYYPPLLPHTPAITHVAITWQSPAPGPTTIINNASGSPPAFTRSPATSQPLEPVVPVPLSDPSEDSLTSPSTSIVDLSLPTADRLTEYLTIRPYHLTLAPSAQPKGSCWSRLSRAVREIFHTPLLGGASPQQPPPTQHSSAPLDGSLWSGGYYFGPDGRRWILAYDGKTMAPVFLPARSQVENTDVGGGVDRPMQFLVHNKPGTIIRYM